MMWHTQSVATRVGRWQKVTTLSCHRSHVWIDWLTP